MNNSLPYKKVSLVDRVFEKLENDILFGNYPRGQVLTELQLAEELGVSRTPIHEALRRLEQERLLEDTSKGYVVLGITKKDLEDIMDVRYHVEGMASYYATVNRTKESLDELRHIIELQEFYTQKNDTEHIKTTDDEFHSEICHMCQHQVIADVLIPLHKKIQKYRRASIRDIHRTATVVMEHRAIYDAIASGDAEEARRLTAKHIENAKASMIGEAVD